MNRLEKISLKSNYEKLENSLKSLIKNIPEIIAAAVISVEGMPIISILPQNFDEDRLAALTAVISTISERVVREMSLGLLKEVHVKGKNGYFFMFSTGRSTILSLSTTKEINHKLGLILFECDKICEKISHLF